MDVGSWRPARESPNTNKKCNINQDGEGLEQCIKVMDLTSRSYSALLCFCPAWQLPNWKADVIMKYIVLNVPPLQDDLLSKHASCWILAVKWCSWAFLERTLPRLSSRKRHKTEMDVGIRNKRSIRVRRTTPGLPQGSQRGPHFFLFMCKCRYY